MNDSLKKHALRLAILASLPSSHAAIAGEVTFDGTLAPAGGRVAGTLPPTNGTYTINQSDGVTRGANLFHSFGRFNLDAGETGLFTTTDPAVQNVISRVTGGQQSTINGTLRLSALQGGTPNLFFINPSGVTLGSSAVVDVPGSFFLSTANNLAFADGTVFTTSAVPNPVLTTAAPQSFGFLTDQPNKISIARVGSLDTVQREVTLVGGDLDLVSDGVLTTVSVPITEADGAVVDRLAFPSLNIASVASTGTVPIAILGQDLAGDSLQPGAVLDLSVPSEFAGFTKLGKVSFTGPGPMARFSTDANSNTNLVIVADSATLAGLDLIYGSYRIDARNSISVSQSTFFDTIRGPIQAKLLADFVTLTDDMVRPKGRLDIAARQQLKLERVDVLVGEDRDFQFSNGPRRISSIRLASDGDLVLQDSHFSAARNIPVVGSVSLMGHNVTLSNTELDFLVFGPISLLASENLELNSGARILASGSETVTLNGRKVLVTDSIVDLRNNRTLFCEGQSCLVFAPRNPESLSIGNCSLASCTTTDSVILRNAQITTAVPGGNADGTNLARSAPIVISANDVSIESSKIESSSDVRGLSTSVFFTGPDSVFNFSTARDDDRLGDAGPITISAANRFTMTGESSRITASTTGRGDAGQVSVNAGNIDISGGTIESRNSFVAEIEDGKPLGTAGAITLTADRIALGKVTISTDTETPNLNALPASISITSRQDDLTLDGTQISATTSSAATAGSVALNSNSAISLRNGATVATTTNSNGAAGNIAFNSNGNVALQSGATIRSESTATAADAGRAGTVTITGAAIAVDGGKVLASIDGGSTTTATADVMLTANTGNIELRNQAQITVDTSGDASGGNIGFATPANVSLTGLGTNVSSSSTGSGTAGSIELGAATQRLGGLRVTAGAAVQANTSSIGSGGAINVFAANATLTGAGSTLASNATDAGDGGTILVDATNVRLANGARIQSTATGSGDSGAIALNVARDLRLTDGEPASFAAQTGILTNAQQSSGGNITATIGGNLLLANSRIESSVATAAGKGGDINLQTQGLLMSSSQIFARADQGNGGGITIARRNDLAPGPFLIDANSAISAQSRAAVSGVIAVDSTDTNVTTVIDPLAATLTQTPALAANPCSARQSGAPSTFVRDTDGGVSPLPDNYFTAGVLATLSTTKLATASSEKISLDTLMGATYGCAR